MKLVAAIAPTKYIERRPLKGMARPNDGYLIGIAIEMTIAVVGSLSSGLSGAIPPIAELMKWYTPDR